MGKIFEDPKFLRAIKLKESFDEELGTTKDWLLEFRKWLDGNGVNSEGEDGYPTEEAYNLVADFIQFAYTKTNPLNV